MAVGTEQLAGKDVSQFVDEHGNEHTGHPHEQVREAQVDGAPSHNEAHEPEHGMDTHVDAENPEVQIIWTATRLEEHGSYSRSNTDICYEAVHVIAHRRRIARLPSGAPVADAPGSLCSDTQGPSRSLSVTFSGRRLCCQISTLDEGYLMDWTALRSEFPVT